MINTYTYACDNPDIAVSTTFTIFNDPETGSRIIRSETCEALGNGTLYVTGVLAPGDEDAGYREPDTTKPRFTLLPGRAISVSDEAIAPVSLPKLSEQDNTGAADAPYDIAVSDDTAIIARGGKDTTLTLSTIVRNQDTTAVLARSSITGETAVLNTTLRSGVEIDALATKAMKPVEALAGPSTLIHVVGSPAYDLYHGDSLYPPEDYPLKLEELQKMLAKKATGGTVVFHEKPPQANVSIDTLTGYLTIFSGGTAVYSERAFRQSMDGEGYYYPDILDGYGIGFEYGIRGREPALIFAPTTVEEAIRYIKLPQSRLDQAARGTATTVSTYRSLKRTSSISSVRDPSPDQRADLLDKALPRDAQQRLDVLVHMIHSNHPTMRGLIKTEQGKRLALEFLCDSVNNTMEICRSIAPKAKEAKEAPELNQAFGARIDMLTTIHRRLYRVLQPQKWQHDFAT